MAHEMKATDDQSKTKYCCVTCGTEVDELSHHYKEGVIKIIHCVRKIINTKKLHFLI